MQPTPSARVHYEQELHTRTAEAGARRRRHMWGLCIMAVAFLAAIGRAQPVFSPEDLERAMKAVGRYVELTHSAIGAGDFETAKTRVARARNQLAPTIAFWRNNKEADAVKFLREAIAALDELDLSLSNEPIDRAAAGAAAKKVDAACQRCHAVYREQDPTSKKFVVKLRR